MKKTGRLLLIAMTFALVFPFNKPQKVQASDIPPLNPGQTYDLYDGKLAQENLSELNVRNYMWRMYNPNSGEHFYTAADKEKNHLVSLGWRDEGVAWYTFY